MTNLIKTKGVDVSSSNGNIDISKIKKTGYNFIMIRCGFGDNISSQDDTQFEANVAKAERLGMPWGVYLYSYATNQTEAKSEVAHIVRMLKGKKPTLPIALDVEDRAYYQRYGVYSKSALSPIVSTILDGIKKAGYYPMLYTGKYWLDGYDGINGYIDKSIWSKYDLWIASWTKECLYKGSNLGMWQYGGETNPTESNNIPGIGVIDKNIIYKDYPTIIKKGGYNNWPKSSGDTTPVIPIPTPTQNKPSLSVQGVANGKWLKVIKDGSTYAGILGKALVALAAKVSKGTIEYSVHLTNGKWLSNITGWNYKDYINGYAGSGNPAEKGKAIDAIKMNYKTPSDVISKYGYYKVAYRVHILGGGWLDWQYDVETTNGQDGYAGIFGKTIDAVEAKLVKA